MSAAVVRARGALISRIAASLIGSYTLVWGFVTLLIALQVRGGIPFGDAQMLAYLLAFLVFLVMLAPAGAVVWLIPGGWSAGGFIFAIVFAWAVKAALIEPFAIACMMQVYFQTIEGQQPDPQWEARIAAVSRKFTEMKEKAVAWMSGGRQQGAGPAPLPPTATGA